MFDKNLQQELIANSSTTLQSPFIVIRFTHGSAGRFLSTVLQLSPDVAHWNQKLKKSTNIDVDQYCDYLEHCFPKNPSQHLRVEPDLPYESNFYSGTYSRGEDVDFDDYIEHQRKVNCEYFFDNIKQHKKINLILHKSKIPKFMHGSNVINVIIDTPKALDLTQKMLWLKHYQVINGNTIKRLAHNPDTCNQKRSHLVRQYCKESSIVSVDSIPDFYQTEIIDNSDIKIFCDTQTVLFDETNSNCTQHFFYLNNIFDKLDLFSNIIEICNEANLRYPDKELVSLTFDKWWSSQSAILDHWDDEWL